MLHAGDVVQKGRITKMFGPHALAVLTKLEIEALPRARGAQPKYKVLVDVLDADIKQRINQKYTMNVTSAASDALGEIQSMVDELHDWRSGMEGTGLENTETFSTLTEAIDTIEGVDLDVDAPELENEPTVWVRPTISSDPTGRAARLSRALETLQDVISSLDGFEQECPDCDEGRVGCEFCDGTGEFKNHEGDELETCGECSGEGDLECSTCDGTGKKDDDGSVESYRDSLQTVCDELEGVEFPTMYGG